MNNILTRRARLLVAPLLAAALLLAACGGTEEGSGEREGGSGAPASPGITEDTVKLGASAGLTGATAVFAENLTSGMNLYFDSVNASGGVEMGDGITRTIDFIVYDDGFQGTRGVENARRLCEQDEVFAIAGSVGLPAAAQEQYVNQSGCPSIWVAAGNASLSEPDNRYQMPLWPRIQLEGAVYARHIAEHEPDAKIAFLKQNSDVGDEFEAGLLEELEAQGMRDALVATEAVEPTDTTVDTPMERLRASGADTLVFILVPGQAAQAVRIAKESGWDPTVYVYSQNSAPAVLEPAGLDNVEGVLTADWLRDSSNAEDEAVSAFLEAGGTPGNQIQFTGWTHAAAMVRTLELMDAPTREALMNVIENLDGVELAPLADGVTLTTGGDDRQPVQAFRMKQFNDGSYQFIGEVIDLG